MASTPAADGDSADDPALARSVFCILDRRDQLRLVLDTLPEGDALCTALVCRRFRAALFARWPLLSEQHSRDGERQGTPPRAVRFHTSLLRDMAAVSPARFQWARLGRLDASSNGLVPPPRPSSDCLWLSMAPRAEVVRRLAEHGALEVLQMLREEQGGEIGWDSSACTAAVKNGHLDMLQWLRSEGCHLIPTAALCCRRCVDNQIAFPQEPPRPLATASELLMECFDPRLSAHEHGEWTLGTNEGLLQRMQLSQPVPTYGNCSNGHAGMESEVLRIRYRGVDSEEEAAGHDGGPALLGMIETHPHFAPTAENTWFPPFEWNPASCGECGTHLGWVFTPPADRAEELSPFISLRTESLVGDALGEPLTAEWHWPRCLTFEHGTPVVLAGLTNATELNGKRGIVLGFDTARERYQVRVEGRARPVNAKVDTTRYDTRVADDQPLESMAVEEWDEPLPPSAMLPAPGWHPGAPKRRVPDAVIHRDRLGRRRLPTDVGGDDEGGA